MKPLRTFFIGYILALSLLVVAPPTFAQEPSVPPQGTAAFYPLAKAEQSERLNGLYGATDLGGFVNKLFTFSLSLGAILGVLRLGWAGYLYMGSEFWGSKTEAKKIIGDVVLGLFLLLGSYLILYQINPEIFNLQVLTDLQKFKLETLNTPPDASRPTINDNSDVTTGRRTIDNGCTSRECQAANGLGPNPGIGL